MDKLIIATIWFLILSKTLFFWLWLWQLKEYHLPRFSAHFEARAIDKFFSGYYRIKFPKLTKKIIAISLSGIGLEILFLIWAFSFSAQTFYFWLAGIFVLSPIIFSLLVLVFQIPTEIIKKKTLNQAGKKIAKFKNLLVIAVAGSYGKTSTKEFLAEILSQKFKVLKTPEHINSEIGISQTILRNLTNEHEIFIVEIGAYQKGKIKQVCRIIKPKIGILTGINRQHMSTFGSQQKIIEAKYELIEALPENGLAVFNANNRYCQELYKKTTIAKKIVEPNKNLIKSCLLPWDIENISMAYQTAKTLEVENIDFSKISSQIKIKKGLKEMKIIDASYSANPHGVLSHLEYLKTCQAGKIIVMPCLIELGRASKQIHQQIGERIGQVCDLAVITTKDRFKELRQGALGAGMKSNQIMFLTKPKQIFEKIVQPGSIILLESRVPIRLFELLLEKQ